MEPAEPPAEAEITTTVDVSEDDGVEAKANDDISKGYVVITVKRLERDTAGRILPFSDGRSQSQAAPLDGTMHLDMAGRPRIDYDDSEMYVPGFDDGSNRAQKIHRALLDIASNLPN